MTIGIDISQLAYWNTGVSNYLREFVENLIKNDTENKYVLFFSSLRRSAPRLEFSNRKVKIKTFRFPPALLELFWNRLHILPIENLIGEIDLFITSDWTEPPTKQAKKATIIYDLIIYKFPKETDPSIINTQRRKLKWVKKESDIIFTISESSKRDINEVLGIEKNKISVFYPGI